MSRDAFRPNGGAPVSERTIDVIERCQNPTPYGEVMEYVRWFHPGAGDDGRLQRLTAKRWLVKLKTGYLATPVGRGVARAYRVAQGVPGVY